MDRFLCNSRYIAPAVFIITAFATIFPLRIRAQATDLLPDIIVRSSDLFDNDIVDTIIPGRTHLRLSNGTANIGLGQLYLRGIDPPPGETTIEVMQRVFRSDNSWWERLAGIFVNHTEHGHMHFEDWSYYRIREMLPDLGVGGILSESEKVSFCIIDLELFDNTLENYSGQHFVSCGDSVQGLSVGWIDIYVKELFGQAVDVTNIPNGTYWLESEVDPLNRILESDESNNVTRIGLDLCLNQFNAPFDTIFVTDATGLPASRIRVDVIAGNSLPVRDISIPFTWKGPLGLLFDSVSTVGLRTEYFESISLRGVDNINKIRAYQLRAANTPFGQPDLAPGSGPILSLFFRIPASATDTTNEIRLLDNAVLHPAFITACGSYQVVDRGPGTVSIGCCQKFTGNIDGDLEGKVDISDLTILIDHLFVNFPALECPASANIDGDAAGKVDIGDLTALIDHLFISFQPTADCQ